MQYLKWLLQEYKTNIAEMASERSQHEDEVRRIALSVRKTALEAICRKRAVRIIEEAWLETLNLRKKAKKGKGKGKGKKK